MKVTPTALSGVRIVEPKVFGDTRGFFLELYHAQRYAEYGIPGPFVQENHSRSRFGTLRGLHYQLTHPQGKLVWVTNGAVFDVVADIRPGSPTFGRWVGNTLSDANHLQLYMPPGFAHGFCVLSDSADFCYKCTDVYHPEDEGGVLWSDPTLGIEWPVAHPTLSAKDQRYPSLADVPPERLPVYECVDDASSPWP
jgi:dTDP-4-dehydrorhamnose 3,5-epimerase